MNILNDKTDVVSTKNTEIESVETQKQEYKLIGTFMRTRGLKLFGYNYIKDYVFEVEIKYSNTINLVNIDGVLKAVDFESEKCTVDAMCTYFESLNLKNANKRVIKYKQGQIKELSNLKKPNPEGICFF